MSEDERARSVFDGNAERYDSWFDRHPFAYESELRAFRDLLPNQGRGLEVGVGTGRFAARLGVNVGLEPSETMALIARQRGVDVQLGVAEQLPYEGGSFDFILMVTTLCYLKDARMALRETHRVLRGGGSLFIGMLDFSSRIGKSYAERVADDEFFREAKRLSVDEVISHLEDAGFGAFQLRQTIFREPKTMAGVDPVRMGHGEGLFVVIRAVKLIPAASNE